MAAVTCYRPVDRHVLHGQLLGFRELCEAAIPTTSRYIVFDLDRTTLPYKLVEDVLLGREDARTYIRAWRKGELGAPVNG